MLSGHLWTIVPTLKERMTALPVAAGKPWTLSIQDRDNTSVDLHGIFHDVGGDTLVIVVHGLGGSPHARYIKHGTQALLDRGLSCLRLGLRGSHRQGNGIYHAGLTSDIHAAIADMPQFQRILLLGYSMGGHTCALATLDPQLDPRVAAVAALCSPLDMVTAQQHMDAPKQWLYRRHVLQGLREIYTSASTTHTLPSNSDTVKTLQRFHQYDALVIAPHFGFDSPEDYYQQCSLTGRADQLPIPLLAVGVRTDPMIPVSAIEAGIEGHKNVTAWYLDQGGHCYFPQGTTTDIVDWLMQQRPSPTLEHRQRTRK